MPFFSMLNLFLISSSDLIASQLLLEIAHCVRLSPQSVSSRLISSHVFWAFFTSSHLIASHVFSPFLISSQLITTALLSSHVTWAFLMIFAEFSQLSQLFSALRSWCQLILCLLISSLLFSHLLSSSHISSADLSSCQLVSHHLSSSQRTLVSSQLFSAPKPSSKTDLAPKQATPAFPQRSFCARLPSKTDSWRSENGAFVRRDHPQNLKEEDVKAELSCETKKWKLKMCKTELSCETSLQNWKLKMWKRSFRERRPSKSENRRCENGAFVGNFQQKLEVEDAKTKLSCETSIKNWQLKMWRRSFRANFLPRTESWRYENEAFVRNFPQNDMSLLWDPFATRSFCYEISLHCCATSLLWDLFAARSLCCEVSLLWDPFAVRSLCNLFAVRLLLCCEISLLW